VLADGQQKRMDAAVDGLLHLGNPARVEGANPGMRGHRPMRIFAEMLEGCGLQGARDLARHELASIIVGKPTFQLRAAATTVAYFATYVLGNYMDKAIMAGFNNYKGTWNLWAKQRQVMDFKSSTAARSTSARCRRRPRASPIRSWSATRPATSPRSACSAAWSRSACRR
jgi:hypothetical protein